tara:strand:+ start:3493 stop:4191 length:699 start_codon:yes stop_codon:yes gene_type:complete
MSTVRVDNITNSNNTAELFKTDTRGKWSMVSSIPAEDGHHSGHIVQVKHKVYKTSADVDWDTQISAFSYGQPASSETNPYIPFAMTPPNFISISPGNKLIIRISFILWSVANTTGGGAGGSDRYHGGDIDICSTYASPDYNNTLGDTHLDTTKFQPRSQVYSLVHKELVRWNDGQQGYRVGPVSITTIDTPTINFPVYTCYFGKAYETLTDTGTLKILTTYGVKFTFMELVP